MVGHVKLFNILAIMVGYMQQFNFEWIVGTCLRLVQFTKTQSKQKLAYDVAIFMWHLLQYNMHMASQMQLTLQREWVSGARLAKIGGTRLAYAMHVVLLWGIICCSSIFETKDALI